MRALTRLKRAACATSAHLSLSCTGRRAHANADLLAGRIAFVIWLQSVALEIRARLEAELLDHLTVRAGLARLGDGGRPRTGIALHVPAHRWRTVAIALRFPRVLLCPAARCKWPCSERMFQRLAPAVCSVRVRACRGEERVHRVTALCEALLGVHVNVLHAHLVVAYL